MKKILLVGASGTLGSAVAQHLQQHHQVITASRSDPLHSVDLSSDDSVTALLQTVGPLDAIASGGELARFALAMKAALASREDQRQPVMIFDEVDAALSQKLSAVMWEGPSEELTLTANAQPQGLGDGLPAGLDSLLCKPFPLAVLRTTLNHIKQCRT